MLEQCESLRARYATALKEDQYEAAGQAQEELWRRLREARALFESAGIQGTQDENAILRYAEVLHELAEYDLAAEALDRLVRRHPEDASMLVRYGENLAAIGPAGLQVAGNSGNQSTKVERTGRAGSKSTDDRRRRVGCNHNVKLNYYG